MTSPKRRLWFSRGWAVLFASSVLVAWSVFSPEGWAFVRATLPSGVLVFWSAARATLNLRLGCPEDPLTQWGPCWGDAATDAASRWDNAGSEFRFSRESPALPVDPCQHDDGVNTAAFQSSICGMAFGSAIAVTIFVANGATGELIDADVLFDGGREWSTYPGSLQSGAIDFHRVAIHEFGHVLGLAHPDDAGQSVIAIMNSRVSDIDSLQADDVAGVNAIYPVVTSPSSVPGALENPQPDSFVSGISVISGWVCAANRVDIQIDGVLFEAAYGTARADTMRVCGDEENGFSLLTNWNLFGDGGHLIIALADGKEIARTTFTVTTFEGQEFLAGASGRYLLFNFAGHNVIIEWEESLQNFVIIDVQ